MIGLDTNVLIRYLMKDDEKQFRLSEELVESAIKHKTLLHISLVVLCEVVWVLNYVYDLKKKEIAEFFDQLFHSEQIEIENRQLAINAFREYQHSQADFADCIIGLINQSSSCTTTYTFDKKAGKLAFFTVLVHGKHRV